MEKYIKIKDIPVSDGVLRSPAGRDLIEMCIKCLYAPVDDAWVEDFISSCDLIHSLDAWRPVWDKMDSSRKHKYTFILTDVMQADRTLKETYTFNWTSEPHHHLEALASVLGVDCTEGCDKDNHKEACVCFGLRKRTVLDIWNDKWEAK